MSLDRKIFRAYDIRGIYPNELNEQNAEVIGKALGTDFIKKGYKNLVVGRDNRKSSAAMANSFISGLLSTGCSVIYTGVTVEPAIHYFTFLDGVDAAVNITASHNPQRYSGIKIDTKGANPVYGEELLKLYEVAEAKKFAEGEGNFIEEDLNQKYIDFVSSKFKLKKKIKVVVYCGNGSTSLIYPEILSRIGAEVVPVRCFIDSEFPKGVPDPASDDFYPELREEVLASHAQLGVGFDGDGDRVGDMDEKGRVYKIDRIFLLFVRSVLEKNQGKTVIYDIKSSQLVEKYIRDHGGEPKILPTGRAYFLDYMLNDKAVLGCEFSGHIFFKDAYLGYDDGIYATCRLLQIMEETGMKLSKLMQEFPEMISTPELKVGCAEDRKFEIVIKIRDDVKNSGEYVDLIEIDGVRAKVSDTGWFLVRASNTGAYLSVRVEGRDHSEVTKILQKLAKLLAKYDAILEI